MIATLPNSFTHARIGHYPREVEAEIIYWVFQIAGVDLHHALIELLLIVRLMPAIVQRAGQHKFFRPIQGWRFPAPSARSRANKMGTRHFWQRTPRYHRRSALGHREIFNGSHFHHKCRSIRLIRPGSVEQRHASLVWDFCPESPCDLNVFLRSQIRAQSWSFALR